MVATFQAKTAVRATAFAMLAMLALLAAVLVVESYNSARSKATITAHRAAHVVATQYNWMFEASAHALQRIEDSIATADPSGHSGAIMGLGNAGRDLPVGFHYSVFDAAGNLTHSSLASPSRLNIADSDYFRTAREGAELSLSPMIREPDGTAVFLVVRRLDRSGPFTGIATVSIPIATLESLTETLGAEGLSTLGLVRSDGVLLARFPPVDPMDLSGWQLFNELETASDGNFTTTSPVDGVERIIGYWQLPNWPLVALSGIDRDLALRPFWRNLLTSGLLALPILLGMGWLLLDLSHLMQTDERRQTELAEANERAGFLLREIHHRVKNNLQTVSSLIRLEHLPAEVEKSLIGRIGAMVAVHEAMYRSDRFEDICIAPYLERLVENIAASNGADVAISIDIPAIRLSGDRAMQLGLLVNELVANAFKHAFAHRQGGALSVTMRDLGNGSLCLCVADDGPGFDPETTPRHMGSRLVEAFASQLGGSVQMDSSGQTTATVIFPRDYGEADPAPPQRDAQDRSSGGVRSISSIRLSKAARSSKRT